MRALESKLLPGLFLDRFQLNHRYLHSLQLDALLQNHYLEAGLWQTTDYSEIHHRGWENPASQVRGHFLGHWISAAAMTTAQTGDSQLRAKLDHTLDELARCQDRNGGEWLGSIPEKYLEWARSGRRIWAPHYVLHKTFMGLIDAYRFVSNNRALVLADRWADWFVRWTDPMSTCELDILLEVETGGMLEVWADLFAFTGEAKYCRLLERYRRRRLFEPLVKGLDVLTDHHMNTTIPEVIGAARAFEVTGDESWWEVVTAYWRLGVSERGYFCTGGQSGEEAWTRPGRLAERLGIRNQEHCCVYNMIRLAEFLYRRTGGAEYGDYIERNLYNGILAQQNKETGMVSYYLALAGGTMKYAGMGTWMHPTESFWCCSGTLVQAQASYNRWTFYAKDNELVVNQYIPSFVSPGADFPYEIKLERILDRVPVSGTAPYTTDYDYDAWTYRISVRRDTASSGNTAGLDPHAFTCKLRIPWWLDSPFTLNSQDGNALIDPAGPDQSAGLGDLRYEYRDRYLRIGGNGNEFEANISFPRRVYSEPLPGRPELLAFMIGPEVLAGITAGESRICGEPGQAAAGFLPVDRLRGSRLRTVFEALGEHHDIRFIPLKDIVDEPYRVYWRLSPQ
jgi:hypothetical protein